MTAQLDLFDELSFYEGVDVEYKAAKGGLPRDLWETCSAFANTEGGTVWLGISQRDYGLDIHGVAEPEKLLQDFWNTVNNRSKINRNLLNARDVEIIEAPGHIRLVRIKVPRADRRQRPVFVGSDPFQGTYRRNHEGDYRCTESEVRRMFADQAEEPADSRILEGFNLEDLHPDSLRQFRNRFASVRGAGHAWLAEDDLGLLVKLGGWRRDRGSGKEGLTVAGLLMFGRDQAIRDPASVPGFHLDYRERFSDDPDVRWTDRLTIDGTWEGNLFQFFQLVSLKFSSGPGVKRPFGVDDEGYRRAGAPVSEALQEALVNALIHGDYSGQGGIVIDRYIDRLVFSNPGSLLLSREQLLRGGISECRNKSLQLMFQMLGSGDKAGSGIDKIRSSWLAQHWQSPSLRETHQPERIVLDLPMISTLPEEVLQRLDQRFGERFSALGSDEIQAIVTAHIEGSMTNQRLQEMLTLHRVDITHMLRGLVHKGLLCSDGVGRGTRYHLPPEDGNGASSETNGARSESSGASSVGNGVSSMANGANWVSSSDQRGITAPVPVKRRLKPEQTRAAILDVCARHYLSAQDIASLLNRGRKRLLAEFLRPMCDEGLLIMRYPEAPNHKQQAYRANSPLEAEGA